MRAVQLRLRRISGSVSDRFQSVQRYRTGGLDVTRRSYVRLPAGRDASLILEPFFLHLNERPLSQELQVRCSSTAVAAEELGETERTHPGSSNKPWIASEEVRQGNSTDTPEQVNTSGQDDLAESTGGNPVFVFPIFEALNPRLYVARLQRYLRSDAQTARFSNGYMSDILLPKLAADLNLKIQSLQESEPGYRSHGYNTLLTKERPDLNYQELDLTFVNKIMNDAMSSEHFLEYFDEFAAQAHRYPDLFWPHNLRFLSIACGENAEAMPLLELLKGDGSPFTAVDSLDPGAYPREVTLVNDHFEVSITNNIASRGLVQTVVLDSFLAFCRAIHPKIRQLQKGYLSFAGRMWHPAEFCSRAARALGFGRLDFKENILYGITTETPRHSNDLWQTAVIFEDCHQIGPEVTWLRQKHARILTLTHLSVNLKSRLQTAYAKHAITAAEYGPLARFWDEDVPGHSATASSDTLTDGEQPHAEALSVHTVTIDDQTLSRMVELLRDLRRLNFEAPNQWLPAYDGPELSKPAKSIRRQGKYGRSVRDDVRRKEGRHNIPVKVTLPIAEAQHHKIIIDAIRDHDLIVIRAATGSGKTTQVPQFILDELNEKGKRQGRNVVVTQPRRVSTVSVARRVAEERRQRLGYEVGYQVRWDDQSPVVRHGITYMTSGYLLRLFEQQPRTICLRFSHIVLDEVHERDIDTDLLLTALKNLRRNPPPGVSRLPKIILMSATIDPAFFKSFFARDEQVPPSMACIDIPGRSFSITTTLLDQWLPNLRRKYPSVDLFDDKVLAYIEAQNHINTKVPAVADARKSESTNDGESLDEEVEALDDHLIDPVRDSLGTMYVPLPLLVLTIDSLLKNSQEGDILVFLPGLAEIEALEKLLKGGTPNIDFSDTARNRLFKLHSALYGSNYEVWKPVPENCRRIVLATNIAETSITLPNVKYVVDTGYSRQNHFDQSAQAGNFGTRWISKAEVAQRKGRAGRTQSGEYIAMFSQAQYDAMPAEPSPEMLRASLDSVVLRVEAGRVFDTKTNCNKNDRAKPGSILESAPSPPSALNVSAAVQQLTSLRALNDDGYLTAMGSILSHLPIRPFAAKSVLLGIIFRCLSPLLLVGSVREDWPLIHNPDASSASGRARKAFAGSSCDDRLADAKAFSALDDALREHDAVEVDRLCNSQYIRRDTYHEMARISTQVYETLLPLLNVENNNQGVLRNKESNLLLVQPPPALDTNRTNDDLVKALLLGSSGSRLVAWDRKFWLSSQGQKTMATPRSVNHGSLRMDRLLHRLRQEQGDILSYTYLRIVPGDKYPWACETSVVSSLLGMLFAESLRLENGNILVINDWIRYEIISDENNDADSNVRAAKVILEYRKALDRFIAYAMSNVALRPRELQAVIEGNFKNDDFNVFFKEADHPLRKAVVDSVVEILALDSKNRRTRAEQRRQKMHASAIEGSEREKWLSGMEGKL
ncbi:hypothetical protein LTS08_008426 [Lithohypha guttulata]|nr:hypothetical protein LTS08_008426 [Lithohypha guttulata]